MKDILTTVLSKEAGGKIIRKALTCVLLLALLMLFSVSCSSSQSASTAQVQPGFETDFQKNFHNGNFGNIACESDDGYYILNNFFLYYIDKASMQSTIACGKPDCKHSDETCNAFVDANDIAYYDHKIYYLESIHNNVYSMDLDGTNRKKLFAYNNNNSSSFIMHRGYIYYIEDSVLYAVPLSDTSSKVKIHEFTDIGDDYYFMLWADGDNIYVCTDNKDYVQEFFSYNLSNEEVKLVWSADMIDQDWVAKGIGVNGWYISNNVLYYYLCGNGIWKYDLVSQTYTRISKEGDNFSSGYASFDEKYIYINTADSPLIVAPKDPADYQILTYDYQGQLVDTVNIGADYVKNNYTSFSIIGSSEGVLFCAGVSSEEVTIADLYITNVQGFSYLPIPNQSKGVIDLNLTTKPG